MVNLMQNYLSEFNFQTEFSSAQMIDHLNNVMFVPGQKELLSVYVRSQSVCV